MGDRRDLRLSFQVGSNLCQKMWRVQSKIPASHRLSTDDFHVVLNIHYKSVSPLAHGLRIVKLLRHTSIKYVSIYYLAKTCGCCECLPHKRGYHKLGEQTVKECLVFIFHDNLFGLWWFKKGLKWLSFVVKHMTACPVHVSGTLVINLWAQTHSRAKTSEETEPSFLNTNTPVDPSLMCLISLCWDRWILVLNNGLCTYAHTVLSIV